MIFEIEKNKIKISIFGIKMSYTHNNFFKNYVYEVDSNGIKRRIYFSPKGLKINLMGENANIILPKGSFFKNLKLICHSNSVVEIEKLHTWGINDSFIEVGSHSKLYVKSQTNIAGAFITSCGYDKKIEIGENSMISNNVVIRNHDGHTIFDNKTKKPINSPKDVIIGKHCWISKGATILKGVEIADNSTIGANSTVVKSSFDKNVVLAGNPAVVVKTDVNWDRRCFDEYARIVGNKK